MVYFNSISLHVIKDTGVQCWSQSCSLICEVQLALANMDLAATPAEELLSFITAVRGIKFYEGLSDLAANKYRLVELIQEKTTNTI